MRQINLPFKIPQRFKDYKLTGVSYQAGMNTVHQYVGNLKEALDQGIGLFLCGPNGVGKTGALAALTNYIREQRPGWLAGKHYMWTKADIVAMSYGQYVTTFDDEQVDVIFDTVNWLVVDELGRESHFKNHERRMWQLLSRRHDEGLITHFTSNLTIDKVASIYGAGFMSLLHESCMVVTVGGDDRRKGIPQ